MSTGNNEQLELPLEPNTMQLAQIIVRLYATPNQVERVQLQDYISNLEKNVQTHFMACLKVLQDPQISQATDENMFDNDPKMSTSVYCKNFGINLSKQAAQVFQSSNDESTYTNVRGELKFLIGAFVETMLSNTCETKYKQNLATVLIKFINHFQILDTSQVCAESYTLFAQINEEIKKGLAQINSPNTLQGSLLLFETVFQSITGEDKFMKSFEALSLPLTELADRFTNQFKTDFNQALQDPSVISNADHPICQKLMLSLSTLNQWMRSHAKIIELHAQQKFGFDNWIYSQSYSATFVQLLGISINNVNSNESMSIVALSGVQTLDQMLNTLKNKVLEAINTMIEYGFTNYDSEALKRIPFIPKLQVVTPILLKSIQSISTHQSRAQLLQEHAISEIIVQMLETLIKLADQNQFNEFFTENMAQIIVSVCLNLMQMTEEEAALIMNDPTEFVNLALDCCDRQQSNIVKTQACKLLEHICDTVDGGTTCVTTFCSNTINMALRALRGQEPGANVAPTQGLWAMENDPFLANTSPHIQVETCLVALTVISYILPKKPHMVPLFQEVLASNIETILQDVAVAPNASPLEQAVAICLPARFSLLLGYYADMMFTHADHNEAFSKMIDYLFRSVCYPKNTAKQVISLQSIDSLITVVSDIDLLPRVSKYIDTVLDLTCQSIVEVQYSNYFEFVGEFVKFYEKSIKQNILQILQKVIERINIELTKINSGNGQDISRQLIIKCCNIIRQIVDRDFYSAYYDQIEEMLKPIFDLLVQPTKIFFDDEIVMIIKRMIKIKKQVTPTLWALLVTFPAVLTKQKDCLSNLLDTLNLYIQYGQESLFKSYGDQSQNNVAVVQEGQERLKIILALAEQALFSTTNVSLTNSEGAILFQIIFQYAEGTNCLSQLFDPLLNRIQQRAQSEPKPKKLVQGHLVFTYLSAFIYNVQAAVQFFHSKQMLVPFLQELINKKKQAKSEYERKLLVIGVTKFLQLLGTNAQQQAIPDEIKALMLPLVQLMVDLTQKLIDESKKKAEKKSKHELKIEGMDHDDDDDDDDDNAESDDNDSNFQDYSDKSDSDDGDSSDEDNNSEEKKDIDDGGFGLVSKKKQNDSDDDNESDDDYAGSSFDIVVTMDCLVTPVKDTDHVQMFKVALKSLSAAMPAELQPLLQQLGETQRTMVIDLLKSQKITLENGETDLRRVVKVRRTRPAANANDPKPNLQLPNGLQQPQ